MTNKQTKQKENHFEFLFRPLPSNLRWHRLLENGQFDGFSRRATFTAARARQIIVSIRAWNLSSVQCGYGLVSTRTSVRSRAVCAYRTDVGDLPWAQFGLNCVFNLLTKELSHCFHIMVMLYYVLSYCLDICIMGWIAYKALTSNITMNILHIWGDFIFNFCHLIRSLRIILDKLI